MDLSITELVDNQVGSAEGLLAQHGLCLLVESEEFRLLFDTGQSDVCMKNAARLGADLSGLQKVFLSHGHYDHGGGLLPLLDKVGPLELIAHPDAFTQRYARRTEKEERYIGLGYDVQTLKKKSCRMCLSSEPQQIGPTLLTTGIIPRKTLFEKPESHFWIKRNDGWQPDCLSDDQALVVHTPQGLVVLLGCAHAGVINTLHHIINLTGEKHIRAVIGGLHLASADTEQIEKTVAALKLLDIGQVVACHCTGFRAKVRLVEELGERFASGSVGLRLTF